MRKFTQEHSNVLKEWLDRQVGKDLVYSQVVNESNFLDTNNTYKVNYLTGSHTLNISVRCLETERKNLLEAMEKACE